MLNSPAVLNDSLLMALRRGAPPLALINGQGELIWCSDSFAALFVPGARPGQMLGSLLGEMAFERLALEGVEEFAAAGAGQIWRLSTVTADAVGRLVRAEPLAELNPAEAQVRRLHERLDLVQEFSKTGIFEREAVTLEGRWDRHMYRIYQLPDPGPGRPAPSYEEISSMMRREDFLPGAFAATLSKPGTYAQLMRMTRPDGLERQLNTQWRVYHDETGNPLRVLGINTDVTEVFDLARRAHESARRLEAAAEAARIGLWSYQLDSPLPRWNGRMFSLLGLDPAIGVLPLGDLVDRCIHPEDRSRVHKAVVSWWRRSRGELSIEFRVVDPGDGGLRWLLIRGSIEVTGPTAARRAEGVVIDITEQQRTLRQLSDTVEQMKLTTRALGLGTWTADRTCTTGIWDAQMFALRGIESPARTVGRDEVAGYLHADDRQSIMDDQIEQLGDSQPGRHSFRVVWPDGQVRWITSQSMALFDEQGRPDGQIGISWDTTESQLAAIARHERALAVAESQAKSQAMSRISHELRTPLHAMLGFTQLMRGAQADTDRDRRARWLDHIEHAGRHLLAMIDDVLELTRAEVGELKLACEAVPYAALVSATLPLVTGMANELGVKIRLGSLDGIVMADPVRLRQVLLNLLTNAVKYNRPEGELKLWTQQDLKVVTLHVADTGIGIPPDRIGQIFEPFNRLGAETSEIEGSGIGLAIVKVLVESMDGKVLVRSESGQGSEFVVRLPSGT